MATQQVVKTTRKKTTTKTRGLSSVAKAASGEQKRSPGRPKGSKDTKPRKKRSDKGKPRGSYPKA